MTLKKVLEKLGPKQATEIAQCGRTAGWHWFQRGSKQKVPEMQTLVLWADHLQLTDADFGELIRDAHRVRVEIMELLSAKDKRRIKTRSVLRRDLAKEIAEEMTEDAKQSRDRELKEKRKAAKEKQRFLAKQQQEEARLQRLEQYKSKLNKLRSKNGNY